MTLVTFLCALVFILCLCSAALFISLRHSKSNSSLMQITHDLLQSQAALKKEVSDQLSQGSRELANQVDETLSHTRRELRESLTASAVQIGEKLEENILAAERQLSHLQDMSFALGELKNVMHLPHLRGRLLGERSLERLLADFLPAGYYQMQYAIDGKYVDAAIVYPHLKLALPIDSKFNLEQVAALYEDSSNEVNLKSARKKLAEIVKQNARDIRNKYIRPELGTTDYALMYLPSETLYFEVVRDTELWKALLEFKVFAISPNTLAVTVHAVAQSLKYYEMSLGVENTLKQIRAAEQSLEKFNDQFNDLGTLLVRSQSAYFAAQAGLVKLSGAREKLEAAEET